MFGRTPKTKPEAPLLDVARESIQFRMPDGSLCDFVVTDITYNIGKGRGCYVSLQDRESWENERRLPGWAQ